MHYIIGLVIIAAVLYGYYLLVGFLVTEVGPELFYVTALLCSVGAQIGYALALFRTFATSRVWYRRLAFVLACGLLTLTTIDLLYIGAVVGMARLDAYSVWWIWDLIAPVVHAQVGDPWLSFTVKSAFIAPLVLLARGFASTAIKDDVQPAFRSYFYGPAWLDVKETVREVGRILGQGFSWVRKVALVSVAGWHGLVTWPLVIIIGLATLAALAIAGVQLLLTLAMHSVFLVAFWLFARICAIVVLLVEKAVIRVRSRHAKCPHATCHRPVPLPVFRCPKCNEKHDHLIPGRCGVLVRTCQCGGRLPTLFWLGKGRLTSECPQCDKPLRKELFVEDIHIPIYGGPSAGKTMYMMAVTWEVVSNKQSASDVEARLIDKSRQYDRYWKPEFEAGTVREKTAAPFPDAFLLSMRRGQGAPAVLYVYDPAGEAFRDTETIEGHTFLEYNDGLAILIDPLSLRSFADRYKDELGKDVPPTTSRDPTSTVTRIVNQLPKLDSGKKPVALVLTKADVECFEDEFGVSINASEMGADWKGIGADQSATLASWFRDKEPHLLNMLETHFSDVRFFAVSALGHEPEASGAGRGFSPQRVMEPIAWLLSRRAKFANPLRERFIGPLKELSAAAAVIGLLVLLPGFAVLKWGMPYVTEAWTEATTYEGPVRVGAELDAATYEEHVRVGAPRLTTDRVSIIRFNVDESGFLESLGDADVKGYLHRIPCGPPWEVLPDDRTELGLEHLRDRESSHVEYSDDDGEGLNFRLEVAGGQCYVLVAEGYSDDIRGRYTLRAQAGRVRYQFATYGPAGWSEFTSWASLPQVGVAAQAVAVEDAPAAQPAVMEDAPAAQPAATDAERRLELAALLRQARAGNARAQIDVALMYLEGRAGIDLNYAEEARRWLLDAKSNGQAEAAMHLALMYAVGEGVATNLDQALGWFREFLDAHGQDNSPIAVERYQALATETEGEYRRLAHEYLRGFVVLEMEPTGRVRLLYAGSDRDPTFRRAGQEVRDNLRRQARDLRDQGDRTNWSLSASVRTVLNRSAAAQRQRLSNTTRSDIADYLVDQMRGIMGREHEMQHNSLYQTALQTIDDEELWFRNVIERTSAYAGAIKVDARPKDATVFIDGERYGTVDDMDDEHGRAVLAGQRTIRVSRDGYQTHEEIKDLRPRERYELSGSLERLRGIGHRSRHQQENDR